MTDLWGLVAGGVGGVGVAGVEVGRGVNSQGASAGEVMEVRDAENFRLCCPECGYDLLRLDVVDVLTQEQVGSG